MKKALTKKDRKLEFLETGLKQNGMAVLEHKKQKKWTIHDLKKIIPLNTPQQDMLRSYFEGNNIIANGSPGTGKTLIAMYLALNDVLSSSQPQEKIIIVRSAVPSREIGHLPGTKEEKLEPYEDPYRDIFGFLFGNKNAYDNMKASKMVEFMPTSFLRGLTWDDAVIVIDEVQNLNFHEIHTTITRTGDNSRILVIGDQGQNDLYKQHQDKSGMGKFLSIARTMPQMFDEIIFTRRDIVRNDLVKDWICALEDYEATES